MSFFLVIPCFYMLSKLFVPETFNLETGFVALKVQGTPQKVLISCFSVILSLVIIDLSNTIGEQESSEIKAVVQGSKKSTVLSFLRTLGESSNNCLSFVCFIIAGVLVPFYLLRFFGVLISFSCLCGLSPFMLSVMLSTDVAAEVEYQMSNLYLDAAILKATDEVKQANLKNDTLTNTIFILLSFLTGITAIGYTCFHTKTDILSLVSANFVSSFPLTFFLIGGSLLFCIFSGTNKEKEYESVKSVKHSIFIFGVLFYCFFIGAAFGPSTAMSSLLAITVIGVVFQRFCGNLLVISKASRYYTQSD